jgi:hypothetical protein
MAEILFEQDSYPQLCAFQLSRHQPEPLVTSDDLAATLHVPICAKIGMRRVSAHHNSQRSV